ncbi:hypothetical protein VPH35_106896 [Triticum aestivum]
MSTKRRRRARRPPARETLSLDLLLEIVVRSDITTVVRCAATCRILRRAILDPAFGRRLTLQAAAGFEFDPAPLLAVSYFESYSHSDSNILNRRLIHTPDPTQRRVHLNFDNINYGCLTPLLARDGLFLHRVTSLCVNDGGSFELLVADNTMRFQIFSSKEDKWGIVRQASSIPPHRPKMYLGGFFDPVVIGRTVYWICRSSLSTSMPYRNDKRGVQNEYLLLASVRGRLRLLIMESIGISMWTLTSAASDSAVTWNRHLVIGAAEILRQAGFVVHDNLTRTPFKLEGFGERSGSVILSLDNGQLFRLDLGNTAEALVVRRLVSPGSVKISGLHLHEIDRITLLQAMKSL